MKKQDKWYTASEYYQLGKSRLDMAARRESITRNVPLYQHEGVEQIFIISGQGSITVNGLTYDVEGGSFINLNPYHFYSIKVEEEMRLYSLSGSLALPVTSTLHGFVNENISDFLYEGAPVVLCTGSRAQKVRTAFEEILREYEEKELGYESVSCYKFMELEELFKRYSLMDACESPQMPSAEWKAVGTIMLTTHQNLSLEEMARDYGMEPQELNQKLRIATGYSFRQLIHLSRMFNVCSLLEFEDLSIAFIAKLFCYSSMNTFYREFKKYTGVTPEEYRNEGRGHARHPGAAYQSIALELLAYVHSNYRDKLTGAMAARDFHISESLLQKIIKSHFKCSFSELVAEVRVRYASVMLCATQMPVCDIAVLTGFENISTFNRAFKEYMKETAGEYRRSMQERDSP
ncbi:AraC family transcriptional regulator [Murimonas intestini]|uniref:AraC family transcriptional regulator n=1 Tax=Murimonas intestini TaxID=1337051 RepID=UPI0011DD8294|nr:AraC family transcriptional regulator [Murimonas intestini]